MDDDLILGPDYDGWGEDLYDDGIITYKTKRKGDLFHKAFKRINRELGINTKRVRKRKNADVITTFENDQNVVIGGACGVCHFRERRDGSKYQKIVVREGHSWTKGCLVHEIGHALGLDHPSDHSREDTLMSYGSPDDLDWFTPLDRLVLSHLY